MKKNQKSVYWLYKEILKWASLNSLKSDAKSLASHALNAFKCNKLGEKTTEEAVIHISPQHQALKVKTYRRNGIIYLLASGLISILLIFIPYFMLKLLLFIFSAGLVTLALNFFHVAWQFKHQKCSSFFSWLLFIIKNLKKLPGNSS